MSGVPGNYVDDLADDIGREAPAECPRELLRIYAVLALAKGTGVTDEDVHNAWAAWRAGTDPGHRALVPFDELPAAEQNLDRAWAKAIRTVAADMEPE